MKPKQLEEHVHLESGGDFGCLELETQKRRIGFTLNVTIYTSL